MGRTSSPHQYLYKEALSWLSRLIRKPVLFAAVIATTNAIPLPLARGRIPVMLPANRKLT